MARCVDKKTGKQIPAENEAECIGSGGRWEDGTTGKKNDRCFVRSVLTRALGDTILVLGPTYQVTVDFRDTILATSPRGRRWLKEYDRHVPEMFSVARQDPEILGAFIQTWLAVLPFVRAMVSAASRGQAKNDGPSIQLTKENHARCVALIRRFRSGSRKRMFLKLLDEVEAELALYKGLTPAEAVETFRRRPQ